MNARVRNCGWLPCLVWAALVSAGWSVTTRAQTGGLAASAVDVYNFGRVNEGYYRGAQPEAADVRELAALGVRTVVDLQKDGDDDEPTLVEGAGMKYVRIPMTTRVPPTGAQLAEFFAVVTNPVNRPVYVHCREGRHRTGVMTAAYRMTLDGWTADQAFKEMKQYKFGWDFLHPEFKRFVYTYRPSGEMVWATATTGRHLAD